MAAAATPRTDSKWEYDCPSPIRFPFGLTTYYSRLICPVAGTRMKFLVSRSLLRSHVKPRWFARDSRAAPYLAKFLIQKGHKMWLRKSWVCRLTQQRHATSGNVVVRCRNLQLAFFHQPLNLGSNPIRSQHRSVFAVTPALFARVEMLSACLMVRLGIP
jgi:hypothetical protein